MSRPFSNLSLCRRPYRERGESDWRSGRTGTTPDRINTFPFHASAISQVHQLGKIKICSQYASRSAPAIWPTQKTLAKRLQSQSRSNFPARSLTGKRVQHHASQSYIQTVNNTAATSRFNLRRKANKMTNEQRTEQLENDLVDYIMGLWDQHKRFRMVQDYQGAIKLKTKGSTQ